MDKFFTKLASFVTAFALMLTIIPGGLRADETPPAASLTINTFNTWSGEDYKGIMVEVTPADIKGATEFFVTIERGSHAPVVKSLKTEKIDSLINGRSTTITVPFPIVEGTYEEASSSSWVQMTNNNWSVDTLPTEVYATAVTPERTIVSERVSLSQALAQYVDVIPQVEGYHFALDNTGFNVGFNIDKFNTVSEVRVQLYQNDRLLAENVGTDMLNNLLTASGKTAEGYTSPIYVPFTGQTDEYWTLGSRTWTAADEPTHAKVIVSGKSGTASAVIDGYTINEGVGGVSFADLIPPTPTVTGYHFALDNTGFNVGFNIDKFNTVSEVRVQLYQNDRLLAENVGTDMLNDLLTTKGKTAEGYTSPIYVPFTGQTDEYWTLGSRTWTAADEPTHAQVVVTDETGAYSTVIDGYTLNEHAGEVSFLGLDLSPIVEEQPTRRSSGGSRRVVDNTPTGEVAGAETGPEGEVLGAAVYNFTRDLTIGSTGDDVTALQTMLIASGDLEILVPTGYFGELTKAALIKWQARNGVPATGYFGPLTRAAVAEAGTPVLTLTAEQRAALIAELLEKVLELQEKIKNL